MAEKIVIAEFDIDMEAAIKETIRLKEENIKLRKTLVEVKETEGELSSEYIQNSAALKANQAAIRTQEQLLIKASSATNAQTGSIEQLRDQLYIVSKQWASMSEAERENTETGKEVTAEKLRLKTAITELEKATGNYTGEVGNYENATKSLKLELRENTVALAKMKAAGEDNTEAYMNLLKITGELQDTIADTREEIKKYASDTQGLDQAIGIFKGIGSAAQVAEGAQALLGAENKEIEKSIQKMVAIQSVLNGAQEIGNALQKESAFMIGVKNVAVKTATAFQWLWNAAMAAGAAQLALLGAGVAGLAAGLVWLSGRFSVNTSEIEKNRKAVKQLEYQLQSAANFDEYYAKVLQARGATDSDVTDQLIANAKNRISLLDQETKALEAVITSGQFVNEEIEKRDKAYEELNKTQDELNILNIQRAKQQEKAAEELAQAQEDAEREYTERVIKEATIRYEMNKTKRDQALKDTQLNYDKLIETEKLLYSQGAAIAKKELDNGLKSRLEYNQRIQELEIERNDNIEELNRQRAEKAFSDLQFELEVYKLNNKSKLKSNEDLTLELIEQEKKRLDALAEQERASLDFQIQNKLIAWNDYNLQILQLDEANQIAIQELHAQYETQEKQRKIEVAQTNFENEQALFDENILAQLDKQRAANEQKKAEELATAEKIGASKTLIEQKYSKANIALNRAERDAKLSLAKDFASNIATIAGENTKVGKAAAAAAATINTYQAATGAYAALAPIPLVGPALGIAAAAAAVISGMANVRKILATQPGSTTSLGGESGTSAASSVSTNTPQLTSTLQSANSDIGAGIVSRNTDTGQALQGSQIIPVLPVDDVTLKQKTALDKTVTATI